MSNKANFLILTKTLKKHIIKTKGKRLALNSRSLIAREGWQVELLKNPLYFER